MPKLVIYCRIAGQVEMMGVHEFDFPPRAGETVEIERHGERLNLHVDRVEHRVDKMGHVPKLICSRLAE